MRRSRSLALAAVLTALIAVSRFSPAALLRDAATGLPVEGVRLEYPATHLALTPFSTVADAVVCSSARQAAAFMLMLLLLVGPFRWAALGHDADEWFAPVPALRALAAHGLCCVGFLAWAVFWPRAPARLLAADGDLMAVDFHSHTSYSWDGRSWFTPESNLRWHQRAGFGAAFITDHNRIDGAREGARLSRLAWESGDRSGVAGLSGQELSLHDAHVLVYGADGPIDPAQYPGLDGLKRFLGEVGPRYGGLAVMSLPEYYRHHRDRLEELSAWGAAGFELTAASPRGLGAPADFRLGVAAMCRARGLFVTGGSDNHGYGSTSCVWSLARVPGWRRLDPIGRERAVLASLRGDGFSAVTVVTRARALAQPPADWRVWLDGPRTLWDVMRSWSRGQALISVLWLWGLALACAARATANKVL